MPIEAFLAPSRRIAVIGGGISGMAAAHLLATDNAVVLFEAGARLGGHADTVMAGKHGDQPVDMGFIVFNRVNYPRLSAMFDKLEVPVVASDMSFGCSMQGGALECGLRNLDSLLAQRRNPINPNYLRMLCEILRFHKGADQVLTYWMNSLQPIPQDDPLYVTFNPNRTIPDALIHTVKTFRHPVYDQSALDAQVKLRAMNGQSATWFCGAWLKNGFHEDGFASAADVADAVRARQSLREEAA